MVEQRYTKLQVKVIMIASKSCCDTEQILKRIKELMKHGTNIEAKDEQGNTPLCLAAAFGHKKSVTLLLQHNADMEIKGVEDNTPLASAALMGQTECAEELLKHGADIESRSKFRETPQILASVKVLIEHRASIEAQGQQLAPSSD